MGCRSESRRCRGDRVGVRVAQLPVFVDTNPAWLLRSGVRGRSFGSWSCAALGRCSPHLLHRVLTGKPRASRLPPGVIRRNLRTGRRGIDRTGTRFTWASPVRHHELDGTQGHGFAADRVPLHDGGSDVRLGISRLIVLALGEPGGRRAALQRQREVRDALRDLEAGGAVVGVAAPRMRAHHAPDLPVQPDPRDRTDQVVLAVAGLAADELVAPRARCGSQAPRQLDRAPGAQVAGVNGQTQCRDRDTYPKAARWLGLAI